MEIAFWLNVGVQIFFFMSGFLYGNKKEKPKDIFKWYKKQFIKLLIPLIILQLVILIIDRSFFHVSYSKLTIIANILGFGASYGTLQTLSHTWFITYILICYLITPLLHEINFTNSTKSVYLLKLIVIAIFLELLYIFKVFLLNPAYIFNYVLGYAFANYYTKENRNYNKYLRIISVLTVSILIPRIIIQYNYIINMPDFIVTNKDTIISWSHVLLGSSIFLLLYSLFNKWNINKHRILVISDKYNYYIYLVHQIFILNYMSILHLTKFLFFNILLIFMLCFLSGIALYNISNVFKKILFIKKE